jgi:hypothetical protein
MDAKGLGHTALVGWRDKVADGVAKPVSDRSRFDADEVRAVVGAAFFALSVYYVAGTVKRAIASAR